MQRRPVLESRDRMRYTPRREATEPRSGECLQWGLFGHVDLKRKTYQHFEPLNTTFINAFYDNNLMRRIQDTTAITTHQSKQQLVKLFGSRICQLSAIDERYWTVVGHGSIGEKAEQLRQKTWAFLRSGFVPNPRVVLAMGFFDGFRTRNRLTDALKRERVDNEELRKLARTSQFNNTESETIYSIAKRFKGTPIAVRSSAYGDCRGTGIYESTFCVNNKTDEENAAALSKAIRLVLTSEFSDSAIAFRKDLNLPNGLAVIIEPVFGRRFVHRYRYCEESEGKHHFGPIYGGAAYTSTSAGDGYTILCGGMPTGAVSGKGLRVTQSEKEELVGIPSSRINGRNCGMASGSEMQNLRDLSGWLFKGDSISLEYDYDGYLSNIDVQSNSIVHKNLGWLFGRLKKLEALIGRPQYVEWAVIEENGKPKVAILQIADVDKKTDFYEFAETDRMLVKSTYVVGTGQITCNELVYVDNPDELQLLWDYNRTHNGYAVIFGGRFISSIAFGHRITYSDVNNASVLIEISDICHDSPPETHFEGLMDSTGKILMVADEINFNLLKKLAGLKEDEYGVSGRVYPIQVKVTASERQQKAIVELADELL